MECIDGKAVIEKYSISVGELVKAILDGLPAYDAVTGKRVIDQDMMIACPKYETEEQAAKAVDYVDNMLAATRMSQGMPPFRDYSHSGAGYADAVAREDRIQVFLKNCKSYKFPEGYDRPQEPCGVFPLRYDTFHREYADGVHLKMHGDNETVIGLYQREIGAMRFPVADVEARFGATSKDDATTGKKRKKTGVTQKEAAALCGVKIRLVQYWEAGERQPEGYPGLGDSIVFATWANEYQGRKRLKETALAMNRATPINPQDLDSAHHQSAFDDD